MEYLGEKRDYKGVVILPLNLAGKLSMALRTQVVEADLPLLVGNSTLKRAMANLYIGNSELEMLGVKIKMNETASGHFSLNLRKWIKQL